MAMRLGQWQVTTGAGGIRPCAYVEVWRDESNMIRHAAFGEDTIAALLNAIQGAILAGALKHSSVRVEYDHATGFYSAQVGFTNGSPRGIASARDILEACGKAYINGIQATEEL